MAEKKVLIVDGDIASRAYLASIFGEKKCQVLETSLGKEGLIFAWRDHPDLILVDPNIADLSGEELIRKLRGDPRSASIPAIALSSDPAPGRKVSCREAGFNEYFFKSAESIPLLIDSIDLWLAAPADQPAEEKSEKSSGLLVVFLSARGGTGVSSLCANLAMNVFMYESTARVVVVDSVLPIGSIAPIVGYDGQLNLITTAAMEPERTDEAFFRDNLPKLPAWHFHLLAGSPDPESANSLRPGRIEQIIETLKATYDYVFLDIGRSFSNISLPLIQKADLVVIVVTTDMSSIAMTRKVWQYLQTKGVSTERIYILLNHIVGAESLTKPELEYPLGLPIQATLPFLAGDFTFANNQHVPLALKFPRDTSAIILKEAAGQMLTQAKRIRAKSQKGGQVGF